MNPQDLAMARLERRISIGWTWISGLAPFALVSLLMVALLPGPMLWIWPSVAGILGGGIGGLGFSIWDDYRDLRRYDLEIARSLLDE